MPPEPVPADPGRDDDPARYAAEPEGPWWEEDGEEDPSEGYTYAQVLADCREAAEDRACAAANAARAAHDAEFRDSARYRLLVCSAVVSACEHDQFVWLERSMTEVVSP